MDLALKRSGTPGEAKKVSIEVKVTATTIRGDGLAVLHAKKSFNDEPFLKGFDKNLERINETSGHHFIGVYSRPSDVKWDHVVGAILDVWEGEDINAAIECMGVVFAEELEKNTKPSKRGGEV